LSNFASKWTDAKAQSRNNLDFDGRPYNTLTLPCERVIRAC